jgi:membrane fusion protein (multidrug efflux system)
VLLAAGLAMMIACGGAANGNAPGRHGGNGSGDSQEDRSIAIRVEPVRQEDISSLYSTSATLRSDRRATVIARTRGVIRSLLVEEGDRVEAEQPLAELENDEQRIAAARARTAAETARREVERQAGLLEQGLLSEDEYEKTKRDADDARHALELAELELSRTVIRAPFAGVVLQRHLDMGATVADGTAVYDLADLDPLYADINIPERHVTSLEPGQQVRLSTGTGVQGVPARIERIAPMVDPATGTVKVTVAVVGSHSLRPGAFVRVDIVTDTHDEALVVPRSALVAEGRRWHLFRLARPGEEPVQPRGEGPAGEATGARGGRHGQPTPAGPTPTPEPGTTTVRQVEVRIGFENGDRVEIAEVVDGPEELTRGTPVVVAGAPALSDGATVRVVEDETSRSAASAESAETTPDVQAGA